MRMPGLAHVRLGLASFMASVNVSRLQEANAPGQDHTRQQRRRQFHTVVIVKLNLGQEIAQRDA